MNGLNRRRMLELAGGSLLLAGCGGGAGPMKSILSSNALGDTAARRQVQTRVRKGRQFPSPRPDGTLPPHDDRGYRPAHRASSADQRSAQAYVICNENGCPGSDNGGDAGSQPDSGMTVSGARVYAWNSQNYSEIWDASTNLLGGQIYWSNSGTLVTCLLVTPDGTESSVSIDYSGISHEGTTTLSDGTVITASANAGTVHVVVSDGTMVDGTFPSPSRTMLSGQRSAGGLRSGDIVGDFYVVPNGWPSNMAQCIGAIIAMTAVLIAALALAIAAVAAACAASAGVLCAIAALIAAALVAEALFLYHEIVDAACASS
jgi:hypothetical protein